MSGNNNDNFVRVLSRKDVLALAFGAMIGWGWVVMAGSWVSTAGSMGAMLAFVLGGLLVVLVGLTYSELASAMPLTGGEHVYSYRALGVTASFICTWAIDYIRLRIGSCLRGSSSSHCYGIPLSRL